MAYEIGSGSKALTLPNPFGIHNVFQLCTAVVIGIAAIYLLFDVRYAISERRMNGVPFAIIVAIGLLVATVSSIYAVLTQLKFYFGRTRPASLTASMYIESIKETLRQQALVYQEPRGPIEGALLAAVPNLIYAPPPIRHLAQWQFKIFLTLAALFLSIIVTLMLNDSSTSTGRAIGECFGFGFLGYAVFVLIRPAPRFGTPAAPIDILSVRNLALLIVLVFIGPIAITVMTPPISQTPSDLVGLSPFPHIFIFLVLALALYALFLVAMIRQLLPPPVTAVSGVQEAWNISCNPALIMGEFERAMQESWRDKIPNRDYLKVLPEVHLTQAAGSFSGEALEETQPFPMLSRNTDLISKFKQRSTVLCVALDAFALIFSVGYGVAACLLGHGLLRGVQIPHDTGDIALNLLYTVILGALARYGFNAAFHLWNRFEFESRLVWLEMNGQYVSGRVDQGNMLQGNLRSSTTIVQVEGMTFRLWVAAIHSMTFGKDTPRFVVSMKGVPEVAEGLARRLKEFAANQASIANLGTRANLERMATNQTMPNLAGTAQQQVSAALAANIFTDDSGTKN